MVLKGKLISSRWKSKVLRFNEGEAVDVGSIVEWTYNYRASYIESPFPIDIFSKKFLMVILLAPKAYMEKIRHQRQVISRHEPKQSLESDWWRSKPKTPEFCHFLAYALHVIKRNRESPS
ncbi:hypothetical protein H5410_019618 [Solanum commersonii]|uniref:Uncharacterized protein n=1 Tax=Solanum commersonii TaxID=4109 RepID=A0A9J5Z636_SOLCO|nr:hypothetical protein H5410_019618 [Solanum commersonii]